MKVALVYDRVNKWGGAERVLLTLHEIFPEAPLYTSVYNPKSAPWAEVFPKVIPSFLQKIPGMRSRHEPLAPLMPLAFESFNFDEYDVVISVTSEAAKGIITKPKTQHICYCLTPTRYLWSHHETYFRGRTSKAITGGIVGYLRKWDVIAAQRPDVMIAISEEVRNRIKKYYNRKSQVIYPPVDIGKFKIQNSKFKSTTKKLKFKNYYLVVARLVSYKKVDLVVKAFNELGLSLVIVGTGSEERNLKAAARSNIKFVGEVADDKLVAYYQSARALIMPQEEDFGLVAVEAQACGIPVIAYKKGGALDTMIDGKTGLFFKEQTADALVEIVKKFNDSNRWTNMMDDCVGQAKKFSKERFKTQFLSLLKS